MRPKRKSKALSHASRASSSFTHKVYCVLGNRTQTLSNSATTSASATLNWDFANGITTGNSSGVATATATMYVETYNGSTLVGTKTSTFTMSVPTSVVPTISSVTKSDTTGYLSTYNAYVQGKSNLRVQTSSSGAYSSTISSVTINIKNSGGTILRTLTGSDVTLSGITYTGTLTIEVIVKDSRNRTASNTSTIVVATYENPKITLFTAERTNNDDIISIKLNASITNVNNNNSNAKHFYVWAREKGTSSWGSAIINSSSSYTYNNTSSPFTISKDENKGWEFLVNATDSFTTNSQTIEVGTVFELMNWKNDGTGLAIGKVSEKSNTFEVDLGTEFNSSIYVKDTTGRIDNSKYITSDFTNTFRDDLLGNNITMIRKQGTWSSDYFPNYSCGMAWEKDSAGGFIIPAQGNRNLYVGGVGSGVLTWTDECLLKGHTALSSWTPTLSSVGETGPTATYTSRRGSYCKLGNIVFFDFYIRAKITALNGTNNYASISGLPYSVASHGFGGQAGNVGVVYSAINTSSTDQVTYIIDGASIHIQGGRGAGRSKWIVTPTSYMEVAGSGWYFAA